jgi:hypothetical protein
MKLFISATILAISTVVQGAACPFHKIRDLGDAMPLNARDREIFERMAQDPSYIPALDARNYPSEPAKRSPEPEAAPEPQLLGTLTGGLSGLLGGGLLNGVLQPLSGALAALDIPTPQPFGLKAIPGNVAANKFIAPGPTDVRGLCPTLNTLANHGFLSRDGITSFAEAANAVQTAYGFAYDLSVGLSALGLIAGGDLPTGIYSIGGADARVPNTLGPALGLDKHGTFEIDGSISREDAYFGNQANFQLSRWNALNSLAESKYGGQFGYDLFVEEKLNTYNTARATNPEFNAGVKYFVVAHAERAFV